ncbi:MAG: hypothetical protein HDR94_00930 [Bacteroides sp.]|nr:hypothetical protein [Bacteroidales bacterium]MBD5340119.1 hypothetical protein [Bacteroides sp.]
MSLIITPYSGLRELSEAFPNLLKGENFNYRFQYLDDYLKRIGTKSVIIENDYIDRNYMEDYCNHYARCFPDYPKKCKRIHFFSSELTEDLIISQIGSSEHTLRDMLQSAYLGFILLRPIPKARLGKVCLSIYPPEIDKDRHFPLLKDYQVHLLGCDLIVQSIAYQEQDNVISACATSSLWAALHGIRNRSINDIPSPFIITENAKKVIVSDHSPSPVDKGLYPSQIASAIREEKMEPILTNFQSISYTKALVRAYLSIGLPVIFGMELKYEKEEGLTASGRLRSKPIGRHAVTVTGYNLNGATIPEFSADKPIPTDDNVPVIKMLSSAITKFYVHDDQVGPFASMTSRDEYWQHLETRWNYYNDPTDPVNATITTLFIPCYNKIRIRFATIWEIVTRCNSEYLDFFKESGFSLVWDIRLTDINDFKKEIQESEFFLAEDLTTKYSILETSLPLYLWKVDCYLELNDKREQDPVLTYVFDATDMPNSDLLIMAIHPDSVIYEVCSEIHSLHEEAGDYNNGRQRNINTIDALHKAYLEDKFIGKNIKLHIHPRLSHSGL